MCHELSRGAKMFQIFFFFNDTATTEIYTLSLHDALPISVYRSLLRAGVIDPLQRQRRREMWKRWERAAPMELWQLDVVHGFLLADGSSAKALTGIDDHARDRKSTRLNSSHLVISYAVFCL